MQDMQTDSESIELGPAVDLVASLLLFSDVQSILNTYEERRRQKASVLALGKVYRVQEVRKRAWCYKNPAVSVHMR